jgi:hypothetical protein
MDMQDKQFDSWMKNRLNAEISLSKQNRQAAWEKIQMKAGQSPLAAALAVEDDFVRVTAPVAACEPLHTRMWHWVSYLITQERRYHKAHANSTLYYKANPRYVGGLRLHSLEFMRHRLTYAF